GQVIKADVFEVGDRVDVVGTSTGKGFAGVVKRHGFAGGPKTHGQSDRHRAPGSIGAGTTPGRVFKGMRMPGRMGGDRVTVSNLKVVFVPPERNEVALKGAFPGEKNGLVMVKQARKTKKRATAPGA
ncbi:MAG: 50S ribosomal protein L3, partial [Anaerolineae bacterium]